MRVLVLFSGVYVVALAAADPGDNPFVVVAGILLLWWYERGREYRQ